VFVDLDGASINPVIDGPLAPSIIVQSSPGKFHAYWLVNDLPLVDFSGFQKALAHRFSGDPSVCDLPRVLRVPGFLHRKAEPFLTHLVKCEPELRYSREQLAVAFGEPAEQKQRTNGVIPIASLEKAVRDTSHLNRARAAQIAGIAAERVARNPARGRHHQSLWTGWEAKRQGLSEDDADFAGQLLHRLIPDTDSDGELDPLSEGEVKSSVQNAYAEGKEPNASHGLVDFIYTGSEISKLAIEPRRVIVEPFITESSLNMVWAWRGVGKTWFSLQLAHSCAMGTKFFGWDVPEARRVLYIDGEMPLADLTQRIKSISGGDAPDNLMLLPSERTFLDQGPLRLNEHKDQERVLKALEDLEVRGRRPDIIILDNLSSLTSGLDENSNSELDSLLRWLLQLRHLGYAVMLVHHAGKGKTQRGASRREDFLDTSIKLEELPAEARNGAPGAGFTITFEKVRGKRPSPDRLNVQLVETDGGKLEWSVGTLKSLPKDMETLMRIYTDAPISQSALAISMGVSEPRVSDLTKKLRGKGFIALRGLVLTPKGREMAQQLGADELPV
jgi:hypothetical protein